MSSAEWKYDKVARKYFGWNGAHQCWVYQDGTRVPRDRVPSTSRQPAAPRGTSSSSKTQSPPRREQTRVDDDGGSAGESSLDARVRAMRIANTTGDPTPADRSVQQWARDDRAGVRSQWQFWPPQQLTDRNAPHSRTYRRKLIRGDGGDGSSGGDRRFEGYLKSRSPRNDFKVGRVVEILYVSPAARSESAVTRLTPTSNNTDGSAIRARTRRFVIIAGPTDGSTSFTALPINTYNGRGVAPSQVIKSHHAIIHTSRQPPRAENDEQPRRLANGHLENPMREPAIRVETYDRTHALDALSRLDFCDLYDFDFNVPVKIFGKVHDSSRANLQLHYSTIWRDIHLSVGQDLGTGRALDVSSPLPGPSSAATGGVTRATGDVSGGSVYYTEGQIKSRVGELQVYADDHDLTRPRMTQNQLESFMADPRLFTNYENQIRHRWRTELQSEEESEEEESDDEQSSDDTQ